MYTSDHVLCLSGISSHVYLPCISADLGDHVLIQRAELGRDLVGLDGQVAREADRVPAGCGMRDSAHLLGMISAGK